VRSGTANNWTCQLISTGSGRKIPVGTANNWSWTYE
jgi:hypothetical protein